MSRPCAVPGCRWEVDADRLMCGRHWRRVPGRLRREVWRFWRRWLRGQPVLERLRAAQQAAVDAVVELEQVAGLGV